MGLGRKKQLVSSKVSVTVKNTALLLNTQVEGNTISESSDLERDGFTPVEGATVISKAISKPRAITQARVQVDEDIFRSVDSVYGLPDTISASVLNSSPSGFWYFKNNTVIKTDDLDVEVYFNKVNVEEFSKIQKNIINRISNFRGIFGLTKIHSKETYLFNNQTRLGTSSNFTNSFRMTLWAKTAGIAFQNPYVIFTTKDDINTLNHKMVHALNYYAVGFRAQCLWIVLTENLAEYYELFYSTTSWKSANSHIKHAFNTMVNSDSRKEKLDDIDKVLNSGRQFFSNQKVNLYSVGYSLIRYLQEKNFTLIRGFFTRLAHLTTWEKPVNTVKVLLMG
ncbi:hypothetical protein Wcon_01048 [Wolbachia endosymbiont of Cylisticus convexus]|uniref:hypothetical protein n=1 Tax=Wolbachia endosymbiont of Cylisticus convexus TaxID=118728 RepID=UPI000DF6E503|nr:hypothetical protein [Wolbachia endosymbiont of Cylisticus convexus]RDD34850.1 hypothetical protein Wcon_01048 [Wolbachia endosymbiont of Cylisticus convexus]